MAITHAYTETMFPAVATSSPETSSPGPGRDRCHGGARMYAVYARALVLVGITMVCVVLAAGCRDPHTTKRPTPPRPSAMREAVVPAPGWVRHYCRSARHVVGHHILCPSLVPARFIPTANQPFLRPLRREYLFEGSASDHWAFGAFVGRDKRWFRKLYGPSRVLVRTHVRGHAATLVTMTGAGGIFAFHLATIWRERGVLYACTVHVFPAILDDVKPELLAVANGFR